MVWLCYIRYFVFFKQKTAYEMRIVDWSSDVCSSDLLGADGRKLSKSERSDGIDSGDTIALRNRLWALLGQIDVPAITAASVNEWLATACRQFRADAIPRTPAVPLAPPHT